MSILGKALRRDNPNGGAMRKSTLVSVVALVAAATFTPTASAQDASAGASASAPAGANASAGTSGTATGTQAQSNPALMPVANMTELVELILYVRAYYRVKIQEDWTKLARPAVENQTKNTEEGRKTVENLFDTLQTTLHAQGSKVPAKTQATMEAYLQSKGCTYDGTKWSDTCYPLYQEVYQVALDLLANMEGDFKTNAMEALATARESAVVENDAGEVTTVIHQLMGNAIILTHGIVALATMYASEEDRPWKGLGGTLGDAAGGDMQDRARYLIGQTVCVHSQSGVRCDKVTDVTENGILVGDQLVTWADAEKALVMGTLPAAFLSGKSNPVAGFQLQLDTRYGFVSNPDLTTAHTYDVGLAAQFNLNSAPIAFRLEAKMLGLVWGGMAPHYTYRIDGGDRWMGQFGLGVGYTPMFSDMVGLQLMPKALFTTSSGYGAMVDVGLPLYFGGEEGSFVLSPAASFGWMNYSQAMGSSEFSPQEDPIVEGLALQFGLWAGLRL